MKKSEIKEVLRELNVATDFRLSLHDIATEEIYAAPTRMRGFCARVQELPAERAMCQRCDSIACNRALDKGGTYSYKCRYGLTEIVSPIYNFDKHVGFLMMGQTFEGAEERRTADMRLAELGLSEEERRALIADIPTVGKELAASFAKILTICAKYLTLSGVLYGTVESIAESAMRYIKENFRRRIHIKDICAKLGCSKSTLLSAFKDEYGTTVNAALSSIRLKAAKKQLSLLQDDSINDVALSVGFSDQSYFCKVFSAEYGESPSEYRKRLVQERTREISSLPSPCTAH